MDFTKIFATVSRQAQIFYSRELINEDIQYGQMMCIMCVCERPGLLQDEIAAEIMVDKSTVARVLIQLLETGYVTRQVNKSDRRKNHIYPTEKALLLNTSLLEIKEKWHNQLTNNMTEMELIIFMQMLEKIDLMPL